MRISAKDIDYILKEINERLEENKKGFKVVTYYCYGAFGVNTRKDGQSGERTLFNLTTKRELYQQLKAYLEGMCI